MVTKDISCPSTLTLVLGTVERDDMKLFTVVAYHEQSPDATVDVITSVSVRQSARK